MAKFNYDDIVRVKGEVTKRSGCAWVIEIIDDRQRFPLSHFPPGTEYSIEFEGGESGDAIDVHEDDLELANDPR